MTDKEVIDESIRLITQHYVGLLTTVDANGVPVSRWMGSSLAADGIRTLYTLCGKGTRKTQHLAKNPAVCWAFSSEDAMDVVTLFGEAKVMESPAVAQAVWDRLMECARIYVANPLTENNNIEFVTIETTVTRLEYLSPRLKIYQPISVDLS